MQPARFKLHAEERTCSPVQSPNFRGRAAGDVEVTGAEGGTTLASDGSKEPLDRSMAPPSGAENHGADTLPVRGTLRCNHPRARFRR